MIRMVGFCVVLLLGGTNRPELKLKLVSVDNYLVENLETLDELPTFVDYLGILGIERIHNTSQGPAPGFANWYCPVGIHKMIPSLDQHSQLYSAE